MKTYPLKCAVRAQEGGPTRVDVYDDIGPGGWFSEGLTAKDFTAKMAGVTGPVECHVNSGGGDVFDGIAIANALRAHKGGVIVVVDGLAASIASVIAQAGQVRVMQASSMMMIHDAFGMAMGNAAEMRQMADTLDKVSDNIADVYATRSGKGDAAAWRDTMRAETWYTAAEAVEAGLADRVGEEQAQLPAGLDVAAFTAVPGRIAAALRSMPRAAAAAPAPEPDAPSAAKCKTCKGSGRLKHPATGKPGVKCPSCGGTGTYDLDSAPGGDEPDEDEPDGMQDRGHCPRGEAGPGACCEMCGPDCGCMPGTSARAEALPRARDGRLLGLESMPIADKALPVHHTATEDTAWDGPAAVAAMPADDTVLKYCHAWESDEAASVPHREGDDDADDQKGSYKFPHHEHKGGPANLHACSNGLARLSGADIPEADRAGVEAHLRAHLKDGGSGSGDADDSAKTDLSGAFDPGSYRAALKGAQ